MPIMAGGASKVRQATGGRVRPQRAVRAGIRRLTRGRAAGAVLMALAHACGGAPQRGDDAAGAGNVLTGIDVLVRDGAGVLANQRVGLITNQTGRTRDGRSTIDALAGLPDVRLVALFSPEHGIRGAAQAGVRIESGRDSVTGLPIHSLYGDTRKPTPDMLDGLDVLVFDIQDIGARYYTYVWTMALSMQAAAENGLSFVVLDRPNPIGGTRVDGNVLDRAFSSFVGLYAVPMRHGMTAGELARWIVTTRQLGVALTVIPMSGWRRDMRFEETGLAWLAPSPNMPGIESARHYPGTCLFEGTNLSVGRGTAEPFRQIGAPWLDGETLASRLTARGLPGVRIEPVTFTPATPGDAKHDGVLVRGIRLTVTDVALYDPAATAVAALVEIFAMHADQLTFRAAAFDRLAGTDQLRLSVLRGESAPAIAGSWTTGRDQFLLERARVLLYED